MIQFSIILPCYNEVDNLKEILDQYASFMNPVESELILVNNGSIDNSSSFLEDNISNYSFAKFINIDVNKGYGYGIMQGLKTAKGNWIGWSHADLQTDPQDMAIAIETLKGHSVNELLYVKGMRSGRSLFDNLFSRGMEMFVKLILKKSFFEINAQPNIFNRKLLESATNYPFHWGLDLYFYYIAVKESYSFIRIPVLFPKRKHGKSKWNKGVFSRVRFSIKMLKYCSEIKKNENSKS